MKSNYEEDESSFSADAYTVDGYKGIAFRCLGWELETNEDGDEERTGKVVCRMVGDDRHHVVDRDEIKPLAREEFCGVCGQIGCHHDGR
jgi:hypothetical protein